MICSSVKRLFLIHLLLRSGQTLHQIEGASGGQVSTKDNIVVFGRKSDLPREIRFEGSNNLAICGDAIQWAQITVRFISRHTVVCLGHGSIYNDKAIIAEGDACGVEIGRECLFAPGTTIRTSDLHGMYDISSGAWLKQ
jgi:hypothetical protein